MVVVSIMTVLLAGGAGVMSARAGKPGGGAFLAKRGDAFGGLGRGEVLARQGIHGCEAGTQLAFVAGRCAKQPSCGGHRGRAAPAGRGCVARSLSVEVGAADGV